MQIEQFDPRLAWLLQPDAEFQAMPSGRDVSGGDFRFRGCDGPVWLHEVGALAFNDIGHGRLLTWLPGGDVRVLRHGEMQAGSARDSQGRLIACEIANGRVTRLELDGTLTVVADGFQGRKFAAPDDVAVAPDGVVYFTDPQREFPPRYILGSNLVEGAGVYRVASDPSAVERLKCKEVATPGGLALSGDGRQLYISDERARRVIAYAILDSGELGSARPFEAMAGEERSIPHGLCLDAEGNVYVGGPRGVWVFAPDGTALGVIQVPASWISRLAFGGDEGNVLFVLTSTGVGALQMRAAARPSVGTPAIIKSRGEPIAYRQEIERLDPALDEIISPDAEIRNLGHGGFFLDLGGGASEYYGRALEGPFWDPQQSCLFFSDIANNRRLRFDPATNLISVALQPTGHANGATLDCEGRVVQAEQGSGRCISRIERDGSRTVLIDRFEGRRLNRPNDVVVRSDGSVFFTNPWWSFGDSEALEMDGSNVLHLWPDLKTVSLVGSDYQIPNGIAFSHDEKILFVNESHGTPQRGGNHIRAYDIRPDGSVDTASSRIWAQFPPQRGKAPDGAPDGMKVDQAGNLYCGGPGGLWIFDKHAKHLGTVVHGDSQTNNICFGGNDWKTLYFVSWVGLHAIDLLTPGIPLPPRRRA
jgi:gluconolactonase